MDMINEIFSSWKKSFKTFKTYDIEFRLEQLKNLKNSFNKNSKLVEESLYKDLKVKGYFCEMIKFTINLELNNVIKNLSSWCKNRKLKQDILVFPSNNYIKPEPLGISLIMGCWNYPFCVTLKPLISSIAAGNCSIIKPSEFGFHTSKAIKVILDESLNKNFYRCIEGDVKVSKKLCQMPFDIIMYTGSSQTGKLISQEGSKNLSRVILELGGKNPLWIDENTNLDMTARKIANYKFINCGQSCYAPDYIFISPKIEENFLKLLKSYIIKFYGNEKEIKNHPNYSRIINTFHTNRLNNLIQDSKGKVIFKLGEVDIEDKFIPPTIVKNPSLDSLIMKEENFGPVLSIINLENIKETIDLVNSLPKPLCLYYFGDIKHNNYEQIRNYTSSGCLLTNEIALQYLVAPFGGVGNSGNYKLNGLIGFNNFSHLKPIIEKSNSDLLDFSFKYPPSENYKSKIFSIILNYVSPNFEMILSTTKILLLCIILNYCYILFLRFFN